MASFKEQMYLIITDNSYDAQDVDYCGDTIELVSKLQMKGFGRYEYPLREIEVWPVSEPLTVDELLKLRLGEQL